MVTTNPATGQVMGKISAAPLIAGDTTQSVKVAQAKAEMQAQEASTAKAAADLQEASLADPASLVATPAVDLINANAPGTAIDPNTGQQTAPVPQVAAPVQTGVETVDPTLSADSIQNAVAGITAQQGTVSTDATVQGQMSDLMKQFEGGNVPPWAAGALRNASAQMQARGLGASSIAGQSLVQAAIESALPIAMQDASTFAAMESQNLNNRQQTSNLKSQALLDSVFSDQASENASKQFNASSENQTKQFFANLQTQVQQFNAGVKIDRSQFNAKNALVVAQANAQWRQNTETINTSVQNEANRVAAASTNGLTASMVDNVWQRERDIMDMSFRQAESAEDRALSIFLGDKVEDANKASEDRAAKSAGDSAKAYFLTRLLIG